MKSKRCSRKLILLSIKKIKSPKSYNQLLNQKKKTLHQLLLKWHTAFKNEHDKTQGFTKRFDLAYVKGNG